MRAGALRISCMGGRHSGLSGILGRRAVSRNKSFLLSASGTSSVDYQSFGANGAGPGARSDPFRPSPPVIQGTALPQSGYQPPQPPANFSSPAAPRTQEERSPRENDLL